MEWTTLAPGVCPESHSKRLPTVFFEALFRPGGVYQPGDQLYYSFNDTTGYGFHGDFFNGWQDGLIDVSTVTMVLILTLTMLKYNVPSFPEKEVGPDTELGNE